MARETVGKKISNSQTQTTLDEAPDTQTPAASSKRVYKNTQQVDHDLFKLTVAKMKKNVSYTEVPQMELVEHCHFFHTVDSSGKPQKTCTPVGGHFHEIEVIPGNDGEVPIIKVGPAVKYVMVKKGGRSVKKVVPMHAESLAEYPEVADSHTHGIEYIRSEKITVRQLNAESAKLESAISEKQSPKIDGVQG